MAEKLKQCKKLSSLILQPSDTTAMRSQVVPVDTGGLVTFKFTGPVPGVADWALEPVRKICIFRTKKAVGRTSEPQNPFKHSLRQLKLSLQRSVAGHSVRNVSTQGVGREERLMEGGRVRRREWESKRRRREVETEAEREIETKGGREIGRASCRERV